jgi:hypothetical protein
VPPSSFFAVSRGEFFEAEAYVLGDVFGVSCGVDTGWVLGAGGVLDGQAVGLEGLGGDVVFDAMRGRQDGRMLIRRRFSLLGQVSVF